jgi:hypothetical protein
MQNIEKKAESFKQESLANLQELSFGKELIPIAGCAADDNPGVLSRCQRKVYNNQSEVVPQATSSEGSAEPVSNSQILYSTLT